MGTYWLCNPGSIPSVGRILFYGFIVRLTLLAYCIYHDKNIDHIKYTDIDYHVFTNGSRALLEKRSPYGDTEYRYSPLVALIFVPNILINEHFTKLTLIIADILCGQLIYILNIHQGTHRHQSKLALIVWLFNPITLAISTRGSFEPIQSLIILSVIYLLIKNSNLLAGTLFGLSINLRLYPVIYSMAIYAYIIQRKPQMITQSKIEYWFRTLKPNTNHCKFFSAAMMALGTSCYFSFHFYGHDYVEQSFLYHMKRKDLQHNFSIYFYLFRLLPDYQEALSKLAFLIQIAGVIGTSIMYVAIDPNSRVKLRKLSFSLFCATFVFVSMNKVCTSQYFSWYLIYLPLIIDNLKISLKRAGTITLMWIAAQANWLIFAYLYEYQNYDTIDFVGNASFLFLFTNIWILAILCQNFDATKQKKPLQAMAS